MIKNNGFSRQLIIKLITEIIIGIIIHQIYYGGYDSLFELFIFLKF